MLEQFAFEHPDILHMPTEPFSLLCRPAGAAPLNQDDAEAFLKLLHPLRDGGGRHAQNARGLFEAARLDDRGDGVEGGIIEHALVSLNHG